MLQNFGNPLRYNSCLSIRLGLCVILMFFLQTVETLVFGNVNQGLAKQFSSQVTQALTTPQHKPGVTRAVMMKLPTGRCIPLSNQVLLVSFSLSICHVHSGGAVVQLEGLNVDDVNGAVLVTYVLGQSSVGGMTSSEHALALLLGIVCEDLFFNQLRSVEQLGYIVQSAVGNSDGLVRLVFLIQGSKLDASAMDDRIQVFIETIRLKLGRAPQAEDTGELTERISDAEFEKKKQALHSALTEKLLSIQSAAANAWAEITTQRYWFTRKDELVAALPEISCAQLLEFFESRVVSPAAQRIAVEVFQGGQRVQTASIWGLKDDDALVRAHVLTNISTDALSEFKGSLMPWTN